ncbi:MAG: dTMP kinase [Candidatus Hydrothermarchaeales archaeon]
MRKGIFVVIEGIDGSGKGTQSKLLYRWLKKRGYEVFLTKEPTDSKIGRIIREGLKEGKLDPTSEALLFAADRKQHTTQISSELERNKVVISDRYLPSSLAYQGAHGLDGEWINNINKSALRPNLLIILDIDPEVAMERVNSRGKKTDYFEKLDFLKKVREIYLNHPEGLIVDASRPVDEVHEEIKRIVSRLFKGAPPGQG